MANEEIRKLEPTSEYLEEHGMTHRIDLSDDAGWAPKHARSDDPALRAATRAHRRKRKDIRNRYPLPPEESALLASSLVTSDIVFIVVGAALAALTCLLETGDAARAFAFGWAPGFAASFRPSAWALALPLALVAADEAASHLLLPRSESYRQSAIAARQGLNGELIRLPAVVLALLVPLIGFSEEFLFRYGLQGFLQVLLARWMPATSATLLAVTSAAAAFALAHTRYRDFWTFAPVTLIALAFGAAFAVSGNFLVVFAAHTLYDAAGVAIGRRDAVRQPDYFLGKVPCDVLRRQLARQHQPAHGLIHG